MVVCASSAVLPFEVEQFLVLQNDSAFTQPSWEFSNALCGSVIEAEAPLAQRE